MERKFLEQVYAEHHQAAFYWCRQCCGYDDELARDIIQSVYLKILSGKARYNTKSTVKTWLFSVIRFTTADHFRRQKYDTEPLNETIPDVSHTDPNQLDQDYYRNILKQLSGNQAQVLLLVFYHHHTLQEAAEIMDLHVGTVRTHYDRAKKQLKKILEAENTLK